MQPDLTIALCLRDAETQLADMAKAALEVAETLAVEHAAGEWRDATRPAPGGRGHSREEAWVDEPSSERGDLEFELIALDERSRDNTASVLSILHARIPQLRTFQDLEPGTAVMRAARAARGRVWLIADAPFDSDHGLWATRQVFCGDRAALVPGEVLAVARGVGQAALGWLAGGLVSAQREVERMLEAQGQQPAWSPPRGQSLRDRARLFVRGRLGRAGLGRFDTSRGL